MSPPRFHRAWSVAIVAFLALVGAASFRAAPSVLIDPLHEDFGWSRASISAAVSVNLILYGLTSPFAAALMERFGIRAVVTSALALISLGSGLTIFMTSSWQLILLWGVFVGLGTGSMALAFVATVVDRWFVEKRGLVTGILTAGGAAGQLVFLPVLAKIAETYDWKSVASQFRLPHWPLCRSFCCSCVTIRQTWVRRLTERPPITPHQPSLSTSAAVPEAGRSRCW